MGAVLFFLPLSSMLRCAARLLISPVLPPLLQDISYSRSINTGWKPPLKYRLMSEDEHQVGSWTWVGAERQGG